MNAAQIGAIAGIAASVACFQVLAPKWFPPQPGGGFDFDRMLAAGGVGALGALLGGMIGKLIDWLRNPPTDADDDPS
jgi:hypothetical protein